MRRRPVVLLALLALTFSVPARAQQHPIRIAGMNGGGAHNVLLKSDGTVWTWGDNDVGQLGVGTLNASSIPLKVRLPPIIKVAAGQFYSLALSADGRTVFSFGDNSLGELGNSNSAMPYSTAPVRVDINLPDGVSIIDIADGGNHALALLSNGHVIGWGANEHGQTGHNPQTWGNIVYTPAIVSSFSGVATLAAGDHQTLALKTDGTLWAWGGNKYGQLGPWPTPSENAATWIPGQVPGLPPIKLIATGGEDSLAVDFDGNLYSWGRNTFGELGRGTIDTSDGPHQTPLRVTGVQKIVSLDGEGPITLTADVFGNIYTFGYNKDGEVGNGMTANTGTPTLVLTIPRSYLGSAPSVQVSAGHYFSYAFNVVTGQTFAWGQNTYGQLAIPANDYPNPLPVDITSTMWGK